MLLINRKQTPKFEKPARFNLGGLIKKKITWKRNIDLLSSSMNSVHVDDKVPSESDSPLPIQSGPVTFSENPPPDTHYTHSSDDPYNCAITECISLLASDMTSHMGDDENDDEVSLSCADDSHYCTLTAPENENHSLDILAEESLQEYAAGGYYPVKIGHQFVSKLHRYRVLRKLGWGHFSTVWLAVTVDLGKFVALKMVKSQANYADAARDEMSILRHVSGSDGVVHLLDTFDVEGPFGVHLCMVFELMGENILHLMYTMKSLTHGESRSRLCLPMAKSKQMIHQVLSALDSIHKKGVIHTDVKPENILLSYSGHIPDSVRYAKPHDDFRILPSQPLAMSLEDVIEKDLSVKIADLGNATLSSHHFSNHIQTRQYRAPEIILRHKHWGASADVWSVGCLIFELITGDFLFDPRDGPTFTKDDDHLAQIIELLGEFPSKSYLDDCELAPIFFRNESSMRKILKLKLWKLKDVFVEKYGFSNDDEEIDLVCDLILKCLRYDLSLRYDCGSLMNHPWFHSLHYDPIVCQSLKNNNKFRGFTREE